MVSRSVFADRRLVTKPLIATVIAAAMIVLFSPAANAGSKELTEYVRKMLDTGNLPQTSDDAVIELDDNGRRMKLTGQQLKAVITEQQRLVTNYKLKEFKVDTVNCGPQICSIRYNFRTTEKLGSAESSLSVHSEETYRISGGGFILIQAFQVQKNEDEL